MLHQITLMCRLSEMDQVTQCSPCLDRWSLPCFDTCYEVGQVGLHMIKWLELGLIWVLPQGHRTHGKVNSREFQGQIQENRKIRPRCPSAAILNQKIN